MVRGLKWAAEWPQLRDRWTHWFALSVYGPRSYFPMSASGRKPPFVHDWLKYPAPGVGAMGGSSDHRSAGHPIAWRWAIARKALPNRHRRCAPSSPRLLSLHSNLIPRAVRAVAFSLEPPVFHFVGRLL